MPRHDADEIARWVPRPDDLGTGKPLGPASRTSSEVPFDHDLSELRVFEAVEATVLALIASGKPF